MQMRWRSGTALASAILILAVAPDAAQAQPPQTQAAPAPAPGQGAPDLAPLNAGQIQRWFEAYTVLQAQDALKLSEAQYGRFVTRLKSLQESRRRHQQARNQILADLRK